MILCLAVKHDDLDPTCKEMSRIEGTKNEVREVSCGVPLHFCCRKVIRLVTVFAVLLHIEMVNFFWHFE
jgi:hypothetical protein